MWLCVTSRLGDIHLHTREKRERAKTCDDDSVFNEFPGSETYNHKLVKWQPGNVDHMLLWWRYFQKFKGSEVEAGGAWRIASSLFVLWGLCGF